MEIKTKYSIGDKVYHVTNRPINNSERCPVCNGKRKIYYFTEQDKSAEALTERCPRCLGQGKISWVTKGYHWEKVTIAKIVIHVTSGKSQKKYTIVRSDDTRTVVDEPGICETEEKAQERCEILEEKERKSLEIKKAELKRKMENKRARKQQQ